MDARIAKHCGFKDECVAFHAPIERFLFDACVWFTLESVELAGVVAVDRAALILSKIFYPVTWPICMSIARRGHRSIGREQDSGRIEDEGY